MLIASDAGSDEDRRCNAEVLAREINRLDSLDAFELINGERVAIHTTATVLERVRHPALAHWYPTFRSILLLPCRAHVRDYRLRQQGENEPDLLARFESCR